ncbi:MAG: tetratricopeptide repeat protein [Planctomycetes bacterium]|nr:tetratricopeptide repeat protein [Planctomycetota bacterium]
MAKPRRTQPTINSAAELLRAGMLEDAERECRTLLKRQRDPLVYRLLAKIAKLQGRLDDAIAYFRKAIDLKPDDPDFRFGLGKVYNLQGRFEDAIAEYDRALEHAAEHAGSLSGKAESLIRLGRFDDARALLEPIIRREADNGEIAATYALLLQDTGEHREAVTLIERHLADSSTPAGARRRLFFELGRSYGKLGDLEASFDAFRRANEIEMQPFEIIDVVRLFDRIMHVFSAERVARRPRSSVRSKLPVFIVGMPRSGSTLVEQILDAHPAVHGAGEVDDFYSLIHEAPREVRSRRLFPEIADELDRTTLDRLARRHLARLKQRDASAQRIVDKHLFNFQTLGFIEMLHPEARIIHCRRDPLSVCFSIYTLAMLPTAMPFSTNLRHLGQYYRQYERLMRHWRETLRAPMLEVPYEEVVADQETWSRTIVEFCDLPWDDACLRFHESGRKVATASFDQVRRPIYKTALKRYAGYEPFLEPLTEALGMTKE